MTDREKAKADFIALCVDESNSEILNNCEDAISRQAVLDAMRDNYRDGGRDIDGDYVEGNYSKELYDAIMSLPKLHQSEVKKC